MHLSRRGFLLGLLGVAVTPVLPMAPAPLQLSARVVVPAALGQMTWIEAMLAEEDARFLAAVDAALC